MLQMYATLTKAPTATMLWETMLQKMRRRFTQVLLLLYLACIIIVLHIYNFRTVIIPFTVQSKVPMGGAQLSFACDVFICTCYFFLKLPWLCCAVTSLHRPADLFDL